MTKKILAVLFIFFAAGCSGRDWVARIYMVQAEETVNKALELKSKKTPYEARRKYYATACSYFKKAFHYNTNVFTLARLEEAIDACWKANDVPGQEKFKQFQEQYSKSHPKELEYGDSMGMMDMGG